MSFFLRKYLLTLLSLFRSDRALCVWLSIFEPNTCMHARMHMQTLSLFTTRQTNQHPQGLLAGEKGQRALLFSLWFSYYTEINTVKLFCATQGLWTQREWALNAFISLSLPYLLLFPCLFDTHAHKPHIFRHYQTNSWNYGETRCMHQASVGVEECVQWLIRRRIWQQH